MFLVSCAGGLPPSLQREIADENSRIATDEQALQRSQNALKQDFAQAPDLFADAVEPVQWTADLSAARTKLATAKRDGQQLSQVREEPQARRLLAETRSLRTAAENSINTTEAAASKWLAFRRNLPTSLENMNREYQAIHTADLTPVAKTIAQADKDWPAKATYLDDKLATLRAIPQTADGEWSSIATARQDAAAGKATGKEVATLIETDAVLSQQAKTLAAAPAEMAGLCGQLYVTWDKILTDLDQSHYGVDSIYREKVKTVRTRYIDVAAKKTETHSDEQWTNVSEARLPRR